MLQKQPSFAYFRMPTNTGGTGVRDGQQRETYSSPAFPVQRTHWHVFNVHFCPVLLQVDRLEQELMELRRSQEAEANAAAARAQTTGVLEEYRTRAQQALKRANEITSQTASENKRLEASGLH